jgi:hypothetical protein
MKRVIISALIVLGLAACESEPSRLDVDINEGVVHNVEVSLKGATRATSDKGFDLENIASTEYELRYILEIYLNGATHSQTILYTNETSVSIPVRLAPEREYRIVVWADLVQRVNGGVNGERDMTKNYDRYYKTSNGLRAIEVLGDDWVAMDESRDAYTDYEDIVGYSSTTDIKLELTRPFSKLRIVTTDVADTTATTPKSVEVSYLRIPTKYDAYTATASKLVSKSATIDIDLSSPVYTDETNELTLYTDYIFADNEHSDVNLSIDIKDKNNTTIKRHELSDIKTKRNMLTTLKGKFLTNGN